MAGEDISRIQNIGFLSMIVGASIAITTLLVSVVVWSPRWEESSFVLGVSLFLFGFLVLVFVSLLDAYVKNRTSVRLRDKESRVQRGEDEKATGRTSFKIVEERP